MEIFLISTFFPYPPDNGARIRNYHLLKALASRHRVTLLTFLPSEMYRQYLPILEEICERVEVVERDPFWRDPKQRFTAHLSLTPRDVLRGHSREMADKVAVLSHSFRFDILIASMAEVAKYALLTEDIPRIYEEHNFATQWMKERYETQPNPLRRAAAWVTWQKCRRYERWLFPHFDAVTMVSEHDRQAVRKVMPNYMGRLEVIPNGVDLESNQPGLADPEPDTMVFNGSLTYPPNMEAMRFFIGKILPIIWHTRPNAKLLITGATNGVNLDWIPHDPRILLTGYLEDIRYTVAGARIALAPIRSGSGTRLKILEAMALGTPVVATSKGAEGLDITDGVNIQIANDPIPFAARCLRLLEDNHLWLIQKEKARRLVEAQYDWKVIGQDFCCLVESVAYAKQKGNKYSV